MVYRYWKILCALTFLILSVLLLDSPVRADGMLISPIDYQMSESSQKAVLWFDNKKETMVVSVDFNGNARDFAWIIPVPNRPTVERGSDLLFTSLEDLTTPKMRVYPVYGGVGGPLMEGTNVNPVQVIQSKKVDIYDVKILSSTDGSALANWFGENNYPYPASNTYLLDSYINKNWYFIAVKVSNDAVDSLAGSQIASGHVVPLSITFDTDKIVFPLRISSIMAEEKPAGPIGEVKETPWTPYGSHMYKRVWTGEDGWYSAKSVCEGMDAHLATIADAKENEFVKNLCGDANTCRLGSQSPNGYCAKPYPNWVDGTSFTFEDWAPGEPQFACAEDCLDMNKGKWNNEWCDNHFHYQKFSICEKDTSPLRPLSSGTQVSSSERITVQDIGYNPQPQSRQVGIVLYIFSNHKKTVPGFSAYYAGWLDQKKIESLAQSETGDAWIAQPKKMYLTKLENMMSTADMTYDLYPQDAPDNKGINSGDNWDIIRKYASIAVLGVILAGEVLAGIIIVIRRRSI